MTHYRIHIEEVVIDGIAAGSRGSFSDALHHELEAALQSALASQDLGIDGLRGDRVEVLRGAPVRLSGPHPGQSLASGSARSIVGALSQSTGERPMGGDDHHGN